MTYDGPSRRIRHGPRVYNLEAGTFEAHPFDVAALQRVGAQLVDDTTDETTLADMTVDELRELARQREVEGRSDMTKPQLVSALAEEG